MEPTPKQLNTFSRAQKLTRALDLYSEGLRQRTLYINRAMVIATESGIELPGVSDWTSNANRLREKNDRIQKIVRDVLLGRLGIRDSEISGDLDIMAPPGTSDDVIAQYQLDGIPLIVIGVVVLIGIVTFALHEHDEARKSRELYKPLLKKADSILCADPSDPKCAKWKNEKQSAEARMEVSTWERVEAAASKLVEGGKIGIAIAVPLAILVLMSWLKK